MAKIINPLAWNVPIVDPETGYPTEYFKRILEDISDAKISASLIDALGGDPDEDQVVTWDDSEGDLAFKPASEVLDMIDDEHGAILYRDSAEWLPLAPGTDGDVLTTHGTGADPTWETPSGGGGSGWVFGNVTVPTNSVSGTSQASKGIQFNVTNDFDIHGVRTRMTQKVGTIYRATVWSVSAGTLGTKVAETNTWTGTTTADTTRTDLLITPVTLTAGTTYVVLISATNEANTYAFPIYGDTNTATLAGVPVNVLQFARIAQATLAAGQAIGVGTGYYHVDILAQNVSF